MNENTTQDSTLEIVDSTIAELQAESGDYSDILAVISENQQTEIQLIQTQNSLLETQTKHLANVEQACYWIFFILSIYGIYKFFISNISSWFHGC